MSLDAAIKDLNKDAATTQAIVDAKPILSGRRATKKHHIRSRTTKGHAHPLPKGAMKRWALAQGGSYITAERAAEELGTSIGSAEQTFIRMTKDGLFAKAGTRKWQITAKGRKEAGKQPTGTWGR
jgi:hypothetical protein